MSISSRVSIAWSGESPYEDTDTIVLTGYTYFVDMRVKKASRPLDLDWALAGTKNSVPVPGKPGGTFCKWHHTVDSRSSEPGADEGTVAPDPKNPSRSIEWGRMLNPATGRVEPYEEVWLDEEIPDGTVVAFLEKDDGSAFVGMIGTRKLGVGRDFAWRIEGGKVIYSVGSGLEGANIELSKRVEAGDKIGQWVVRESWRTGDT